MEVPLLLVVLHDYNYSRRWIVDYQIVVPKFIGIVYDNGPLDRWRIMAEHPLISWGTSPQLRIVAPPQSSCWWLYDEPFSTIVNCELGILNHFTGRYQHLLYDHDWSWSTSIQHQNAVLSHYQLWSVVINHYWPMSTLAKPWTMKQQNASISSIINHYQSWWLLSLTNTKPLSTIINHHQPLLSHESLINAMIQPSNTGIINH